MKGMLHIAVLVAGIVACAHVDVSAQSFHSTDSLKKSFQIQTDSLTAEFEAFAASAKKEYQDYLEKAEAEYAGYVRSIEAVWGGKTKENSRYEWVEYSSDFRSRSVVDFENGTASVQVKISPEEASDSSLVSQKLICAIYRLLTSRGSSCPYSSEVDISGPLTEKPVLDGLLDLSQFGLEGLPGVSGPETQTGAKGADRPSRRKAPPAPKVKGSALDLPSSSRKAEGTDSVTTMATKAAAEKEQRRTAERDADAEPDAGAGQDAAAVPDTAPEQTAAAIVAGSRREISEPDENGNRTVTVSLNLSSDKLTASAALYKDIVAEYSAEYDIDPALIYAVMEQESMFNPEATSWVPAYGLMQLVPVSGGVDAYKYVYGKEWIPTKSYLFVPRNNIELGTAYLRLLMNTFSKVTDPDCRRLCVIAGYNTGAGNVSRAFTGSTNISKALPLINKYTYQRLYDHLTTNLGAEEARNYVAGVTKRHRRYTGR